MCACCIAIEAHILPSRSEVKERCGLLMSSARACALGFGVQVPATVGDYLRRALGMSLKQPVALGSIFRQIFEKPFMNVECKGLYL